MMKFLERTERLLGSEAIKELSTKHVALFGCGGVGGYVAEMLVRSGVGQMTLIDFDVVDETNINRQIIALHSTVDKSKVEVLKTRLLDINPNCKVVCIQEKYSEETSNSLLHSTYDYVVDAIDMVKEKCHLIAACHTKNIKIVSAMGAGNRSNIPEFVVSDISKTYNDGLAKVVRKNLRAMGINHHTVVYTKELATYHGDNVGSVAYYPAMCGCVISAYVIQELIKKRRIIMGIKHIEEKDFEVEVIESKELVLVDFYATWCGPCRMLAPELEKAEEATKDFAKIYKLDVDENMNVAKKYGVMSVPTLLVFKNGQEVDRMVGFRQSKDLIDILNDFK